MVVGNIAADSDQIRNELLTAQLGDIIINFTEKFKSNHGYWAINNLLKGSVLHADFFKRAIMLVVRKVTMQSENEVEREVQEECLFVLNELSGSELLNKFIYRA